MSDSASWYAKKFGGAGQAPARSTVPLPVQPGYQQPLPPGMQQQAYKDPNAPMSMQDVHDVIASGNPDARGGAKTRALATRLAMNTCPNCGSQNMRAQVGNNTAQCFDCGWTPRFGARGE